MSDEFCPNCGSGFYGYFAVSRPLLPTVRPWGRRPMSGECDPILVADDDGVVLDGGPESTDHADRTDGGDDVRCEHCGHEFDVGETRGSFDGARAEYVCPNCGRGTAGPPPGGRR
jgi:DNA-directed RNA polymerase subunit RPC12/RpoP